MNKRTFGRNGWRVLVIAVALSAALPARAQDRTASYRSMAPVEQYLMPDRNAEIALARSAAPASISGDATVMVLGRHGYTTAVEGKNGFVCVVERGWMSPFNAPQFWNPKMRGPICFNPPAARSILPLTLKRSDLVLSGLSKDQVMDRHPSSAESEATPNFGARRDELHDVEARVSGRWRRPLAFASDVLCSADETRNLGSRFAGIAGLVEPAISGSSRAIDRVHDSSVGMVGWNAFPIHAWELR